MGYELTGVSIPLGGIQWQKTPGDKAVARAVLAFLEDRRLLFGDRHVEDERHCVQSALQIRTMLTEQITNAKAGRELEGCLKAMRGACRKFVEVAGPEGRHFDRPHYPREADAFGLALGDLRTAIGYQLAIILSQYDINIEPPLASILPAADEDDQDLSWMIGFA
ncbi:MAG: hypothetical protein QM572_11900 [Nocardioides sp.]|uniref:DUF6650 family protein n=1 Tax=Nocardioides sp. TaxID=35761 RepID=UPI0039E6BAC4